MPVVTARIWISPSPVDKSPPGPCPPCPARPSSLFMLILSPRKSSWSLTVRHFGGVTVTVSTNGGHYWLQFTPLLTWQQSVLVAQQVELYSQQMSLESVVNTLHLYVDCSQPSHIASGPWHNCGSPPCQLSMSFIAYRPNFHLSDITHHRSDLWERLSRKNNGINFVSYWKRKSIIQIPQNVITMRNFPPCHMTLNLPVLLRRPDVVVAAVVAVSGRRSGGVWLCERASWRWCWCTPRCCGLPCNRPLGNILGKRQPQRSGSCLDKDNTGKLLTVGRPRLNLRQWCK